MIATEYQAYKQVSTRKERAYHLVALIQALNEAMDLAGLPERVEAVKLALEGSSRHPEFLPERFRKPAEDHYARRALYIDPSNRFSVLAMVWSKGQGTPLHDHGGTWVVECLLEGRMRVTNYDYLGEEAGLHQFKAGAVYSAKPGDADSRVPPAEHHLLENDQDEPSVTIHVFGGILSRCDVFEPVEGGWRKEPRVMSYTPF